jgi:hypothetical protein
MNGDFCSGARANTHHAADHAKDASLARLVQLSTLTIPTDSSHVFESFNTQFVTHEQRNNVSFIQEIRDLSQNSGRRKPEKSDVTSLSLPNGRSRLAARCACRRRLFIDKRGRRRGIDRPALSCVNRKSNSTLRLKPCRRGFACSTPTGALPLAPKG